MAEGSAVQPAAVLVEEPTEAARLRIKVEPTWVKVPNPRSGTEEIIPGGETHHLITTVGVMGSSVAGVVSAVLTLRIAPHLLALAVLELLLAALAAVLVAACGRRRR